MDYARSPPRSRKTGTGKSHLAQALGHRACRCGHTVLYTTAHHFFISLRAARADGTYERQMLRYTSVELLILDDLGLRPLSSEEAMGSLRADPAAL